ncbi:hypothetical protein BSZ39_01320 [Bowdeniella nasicola]|uniref:Glycosyltransferase, GT2 family n=1 Tax=Bowdeniella nasicola TaxID=208480 RepID=A0A1Q5Q546_9ACTO|nr:glycosyltransferase [Bowdeniella nasicola]OKL54944.1 hypothetical protein BSZ39_01320 [Bowdeniella nasicola]
MTPKAHPDQDVTAVVVTCGDTPYLKRTLSGIGAQEHLPDRLVVIDVAAPGRSLGSGRPIQEVVAESLDDHALPTRVINIPGAENFGDAVRQGLAEHQELLTRAAQRREARTGEIPAVREGAVAWLWLLHDDSAPEERALAELLREVELATSIGLAGCKERDWAKPDRLLAAGINATSTTRRFIETDVDEIDQGQLDHRSDVLGVSIAGALIRRDIWTSLGGTDPHLGPFNDGLELSRRVRLAGYRVVVVPSAIVFHAQASYQGLRSDEEQAPDVRRSFGDRRAAQLHTWISGVPGWQVPLVYLAILILTPLRALWRLARKDFDLLTAELRAGAHVLSSPQQWLATRKSTEVSRRVARSTLERIYTPRSVIAAKKRELRRSHKDAAKAAAAPSELELAELARLARRRRAVLTLLALALLGIGIWLIRPPMTAGIYEGGALQRATGSLLETYRAATSGWLDVGLGHPGPPDAFLWTLLPGLLLTGNLSALVPLTYRLAVPLAGVGAWFAAGAGTRSILIRAWVAITWALAPSFIPALHAGELGPALAHMTLPWMILGLTRAVAAERHDVVESGMVGAQRVDREALAARLHSDEPAPSTPEVTTDEAPAPLRAMRSKTNVAAAAGAAIAFAIITAGAPVLLLPGIVLLWASQLVIAHHRLAFLLIPIPTLVLHAPRLVAMVREGLWQLAVTSPGLPQNTSSGDIRTALLGWSAPLPTGSLGPIPLAPLAIGAGTVLLVAALAALGRRGGTGLAVRLGWFVVLIAAASFIVVRDIIIAHVAGEAVTANTAPLVTLLVAGLLIAAVAGVTGTREYFADATFGWRHAVAIATAVLAIAVPLSWALIIGPQAAQRMQVKATSALPTPALAQQLAAGVGQERTLILTPEADEGLRADVVRTDGQTMLTSASVIAVRSLHDTADAAAESFRASVANLAASNSDTGAAELGAAGIGVIVVPPVDELASDVNQSAHARLVAALDATPGVSRVTVNRSGTIWRVDAGSESGTVTSRARIADGDELQAIASEGNGVRTQVAEGSATRTLVLAERADSGWQARYNGASLGASDHGWQQAFDLPAHAGELTVRYQPVYQPYWLIAGAITALITALLAIPRPRREVRP